MYSRATVLLRVRRGTWQTTICSERNQAEPDIWDATCLSYWASCIHKLKQSISGLNLVHNTNNAFSFPANAYDLTVLSCQNDIGILEQKLKWLKQAWGTSTGWVELERAPNFTSLASLEHRRNGGLRWVSRKWELSGKRLGASSWEN